MKNLWCGPLHRKFSSQRTDVLVIQHVPAKEDSLFRQPSVAERWEGSFMDFRLPSRIHCPKISHLQKLYSATSPSGSHMLRATQFLMPGVAVLGCHLPLPWRITLGGPRDLGSAFHYRPSPSSIAGACAWVHVRERYTHLARKNYDWEGTSCVTHCSSAARTQLSFLSFWLCKWYSLYYSCTVLSVMPEEFRQILVVNFDIALVCINRKAKEYLLWHLNLIR